jgi:hypothetical protein
MESRWPRTKNKNSTPAHLPEVLSAARAVCCHPIHGQDSDRSGPWACRHGAAAYSTIIVMGDGDGQS